MTLAVGDVAPDFTLAGTGGRQYTLSEYRGRPVLLVFYPGDFTPVCTVQLRNYSEDIDQFSGHGAQVFAVSPQDVESHEAFAAAEGLKFPLLADVDKAVGAAYGILGPLGFYRRSVFVIDGDGIIRYVNRSTTGLTYRPTDELARAIADARPAPPAPKPKPEPEPEPAPTAAAPTRAPRPPAPLPPAEPKRYLKR